MKKIILALGVIFSLIPLFSQAQWTTSGTNIYNINSGYVGIGYTTPFTKLTIGGMENTGDGGNSAIALFNNASGGTTWYLRSGATGTNTPVGGFSLADNIAYRFVIDNLGSVGIGTTTPTSVQNISNRVLNIVGTANGAELVLERSGGTSKGYLSQTPSDDTKLGTFSSNPLIIETNLAERMRIAADGKVGIGTNSPNYLLDVSGTISSGLAGTTTGAYKLAGSTSGIVTIQPQTAAGAYNFNLPTTAGTSGQVLTSAGGGSSAMTWSNPVNNVEKLASFFTDISATTTTSDAYNYTLPINSLSTDGQFIECQYSYFSRNPPFTFPGNGQVKIYFGAQLIYDTGMTSSSYPASISIKIIRSGVNTARCILGNALVVDLTGVDFTSTNIIKSTIVISGLGDLRMQSGQIVIYR